MIKSMPFLLTTIYYVIASRGFDVYIQLSPRFLSPPITGHTLTKADAWNFTIKTECVWSLGVRWVIGLSLI